MTTTNSGCGSWSNGFGHVGRTASEKNKRENEQLAEHWGLQTSGERFTYIVSYFNNVSPIKTPLHPYSRTELVWKLTDTNNRLAANPTFIPTVKHEPVSVTIAK